MKKNIILICLIFIGFSKGNAQVNSSFTCVDAPLICPLDGYSSSTGTPNATDQPSTFCGSIQNNQWIAFIAGSDTLKFNFNIDYCFWSDGLQIHVYAFCGSPWTSVSNCIYEGIGNSTEEIYMYNLTVGNKYYIMVDGKSGDQCDFSIDVTKGFTMSSNPDIIVDAGEDVLFNCLTQEVVLDGSNSVYGANDSVTWLGQNLLFVSDSISFNTDQPGLYYLVIDALDGNCPSSDTVKVLSFNDILPNPFLLSPIEIFTNTIGQSVFLDAVNSSVIDSSYLFSWTTIDGDIVAHSDSLYPLITSSGTYVLEITHPETGCKISNQVWVNIIDPVSVFSPIKNKLQVEITPTVTNDEIRVYYVMEKTNSVSMQIYNVGGVLLQDIGFGKNETGEQVEHLSLKDFSAGVYFVFVKTEEGSAVRKVLKM